MAYYSRLESASMVGTYLHQYVNEKYTMWFLDARVPWLAEEPVDEPVVVVLAGVDIARQAKMTLTCGRLRAEGFLFAESFTIGEVMQLVRNVAETLTRVLVEEQV